MKRIAILGSTGSIGQSALAVVDAHPDGCGRRRSPPARTPTLLAEQVARYRPAIVAMATRRRVDRAARAAASDAGDVDRRRAATGWSPWRRIPTSTSCSAPRRAPTALEAVLAAIEAGKTIALANKEVLVMAGGLVTEAARRARRRRSCRSTASTTRSTSACTAATRREVRRLILTASGGPFRGRSASRARDASTPDDALRHPTWQMGRKITIDSATLMNKGLEVIEAHWLFGVPRRSDRRRHPPAVDRALDGRAERRLDDRAARRHRHAAADSVRVLVSGALGGAAAAARSRARRAGSSSTRPTRPRFPCLRLAYRALEAERSLPVVLNAANEVAVASFLEGRLGFPAIPRVIERDDGRARAGRGDDAGRRARGRSAGPASHAQEIARGVELKV